MRIALFSDTFPPQINGVSHVVAQLAEALAGLGHSIRVYTACRASGEYFQSLSRGSYSVRNLPSLPLYAYPDLRFTLPLGLTLPELRRWRPQIIHSHTPFGVGIEAVYVARRLHVPLIGTHHTFYDHYLKHIYLDARWSQRLSWKLMVGYYNRCTAVVSPSQSLADALSAYHLRSPVEVLANPIDTCLFRPPAQSRALKEHADRRTLVYMGRLSYEKNIEQVIRAFGIAQKTRPDLLLRIVGDGPERPALEALANRLELQTRVCFTGFLRGTDLVQALAESDVFITASKTENMPLSVLEGMATGLPVVAPALKGLPEIVLPGKSGLLTESDAPEELAQSLLTLLADDPLYAQLSEGAIRVAQGYAHEGITRQLVKIYERIHRAAQK